MRSRFAKGMQKGFVLLVGSALVAFAGCSDTPYSDGSACHQGDTRECVGPGACKGAQECLPSNLGFDSCICAGQDMPNSGGGEAGMTGQGDAGSDAVGGMPTNPGGAPGTAGATEPMVGGAGGEGGAPVEYACDPIGNVGCSSTQNCSLDGAERACVPAGTKTLLVKCELTSECAPGLLCHVHNCVKACDNAAACKAADPSTTCGQGISHPDLGVEVIGACLKTCDLTAQNCPAGQACYLGLCLTPVLGGVEGGACEFPNDCAKGFVCMGDNIGQTCRQYCSTTAPDPCAVGSSCFSLDDVVPGLPAEWGACLEES